jgi:hypothetical protein
MMALPFGEVNWLAVLVGALIFMAVGFVWYARPVFGNAWAKMVGINMEQMQSGPGIGYLYTTIGSLVASLTLALLIITMGSTSFVDGLLAGALVGVGFAATAMLSSNIFEGRPMRLWLIQAGYQVVSLALVGGLLAVWR